MVKNTLCFALMVALLLALAACGGRPEPTAEPPIAPEAEILEPEPTPVPTAEPTADPEPEPQDPLERALAYLRQRDRDWNYVTAHMGTYQELYRLTHPGADVQILGGGIGAKEITVQVAGEDARAFGEAGIFSDRITVSPVKSGGPDFPLDLPIPREPETDHLSERGMRITMERAVWPVGTEYLRFTIGNETNRGLEGNEICLEKYTEGGWKRYIPPMSIGGGGLYLEAYSASERFKDLQFYPRLGEGLYRIIVTPGDDWAEFVVRRDAEPLDMTPVKYRSWPEAALLLAGLPENVESELHETEWPALSWKWRLTEDRRVTDEELAALLLGEEAEYDPETELWRAGNRTLDLKDGAHLTAKDPLVRALELLVPAWGADTPDSSSIPTTAEAGWVSAGRFVSHTIPFLSLYDGRREEIGITDQAGILRSAELVNGGGYKVYVPDCAILTARLEELLAEKRAELGEAAFLAEYGDLADFSFRTEELAQLYLVQVPIRARLVYAIEAFAYEAADVSPWGEPDGAAWFLYDRESREILALSARYLGYRLAPEDAWETLSPLEQAVKFLPLMEGEEELRLTGMDYVLIPGQEEGTLMPAWRMLAETTSGEVRTWVVSARTKKQRAYDLHRRAYLLELQKPNGVRDIFRRFREQYPDMDVWEDSWGIDVREDGRECLTVLCHGADIPALEASGFLPDGMVLEWMESPFNQKEAHPCPREPEWEKDWGTVRLAMGQAEYPPYPESLELTVGWEKARKLESLVCKKYVEGEWRQVCRVLTDAPLPSDAAGETTLRAYPLAKLGPGLYRLYLNDKFWVEFQITDQAE